MSGDEERDERHRRRGDDGVPWKGIAIGLLSIALTWASTEWYRAKDQAVVSGAEHQKDHDTVTRQGTTIEYMQRDLAYVTKRVEDINNKQDETARTVDAIGKALGVRPARSDGYTPPPTPRFSP